MITFMLNTEIMRERRFPSQRGKRKNKQVMKFAQPDDVMRCIANTWIHDVSMNLETVIDEPYTRKKRKAERCSPSHCDTSAIPSQDRYHIVPAT
jgi:hypothetical protein